MVLFAILVMLALLSLGLAMTDVAFNSDGYVLFSADGEVLFDCDCCCPEQFNCFATTAVKLGSSGSRSFCRGTLRFFFNDLMGAYGDNTGSFTLTLHPSGSFAGGVYTIYGDDDTGTLGPVIETGCDIDYEATGTITIDGVNGEDPDGNGLTAGTGWNVPGGTQFALYVRWSP